MYSSPEIMIFSRRQIRFATFVGLVFVSLIVFSHWSARSLLSSPRFPDSLNACPAAPPWPPIQAPKSSRLRWRELKQQYPVSSLSSFKTDDEPNGDVPAIQFDFASRMKTPEEEATREERRAAVKAAFARSWTAYRKYAWKQDELMPLSGGWRTTFGGWGATLVDSLDTLLLLNMTDEFDEAVAAVREIEFTPDTYVNVFEVTIRYLGGLIAAYDLTECKEPALLEKAIELADMVLTSFDTPNRMPVTRWNSEKALKGRKQTAPHNAIIAELASFSSEFTRLSQITGDMRYYDAVKRITDVLEEQQMKTKIPGLWPLGIDLQEPDLTTGKEFSLGAMSDSAYEYLPKTYQLLLRNSPTAALQYKNLYTKAAEAIIQHLLFRPMHPSNPDILFPEDAFTIHRDELIRDHKVQHLACFAGGMFLLGGSLTDNATHVDIGKRLTDGCIWAYRTAPHGIMPESFTLPSCPSLNPCDAQFLNPDRIYPHLSSVLDLSYNQRPEAIESLFYAYRITGDTSYQDIAWEMFLAVEKYTKTEKAYAAIEDVWNSGRDGGLEQRDVMESFWLGETLKYFWLVFAGEETVGLDGWVFNTEAHPFRLV